VTAIVRPDGPFRWVKLGQAGWCRVRTGELVHVLRGGDGLRVEYLPALDDTPPERPPASFSKLAPPRK
jgi:hypothetical protein